LERALLALAFDLNLTPHQVGAMYWPEVCAMFDYKAERARVQSAQAGNVLDMEPGDLVASLQGAR
jgi:hypothetical protein